MSIAAKSLESSGVDPFFRSGPQFRGDNCPSWLMGSHRSRMIEKSHVRPTCFVLLSVQGKQLCPCKLNLYMLYLLCFVMFVHISCFFFSLLSLFGGNKEIIIINLPRISLIRGKLNRCDLHPKQKKMIFFICGLTHCTARDCCLIRQNLQCAL